ncbi:MAG: AAA family ATPase [Ignavibacteriae bacterium]|nr:AAA family ATPase [Ignavibacteriota bacterium]MCB9242656.1 AAA family ATPase [Ignavibacteriales bacterium]
MFENIVGQERVKRILTSIHKSERLAHAYIFYGKEGTGKDAAAIEFARLVNNESPDTNMFRTESINFITALPSGNDSDENEDPLLSLDPKDFDLYREEIGKKSADPYYKISIPRANNIRINSIRYVKKNIYLTGREGKKKIYIFSEADKMSPQSANALLKILEEPPRNSLLILTTSRLNSLPPTIIGRCQCIKFDDIPPNEIVKYIVETYNDVSEEEALLYANLSEGSISVCNSILENNTLELREKVLSVLLSLLAGKTLELSDEISSVTAIKDKELFKNFLAIMLLWFRDLSLERNSNEKFIVNMDKLDRIKKFNSKFAFDYYEVVLSIENAIREIDMNINKELIMYNLCYTLKSRIKLKG